MLDTIGYPTPTQSAWLRIQAMYQTNMDTIDQITKLNRWGEKDTYHVKSPSILDAIQAEYREKRIIEADRDAMRKHVSAWQGEPGVTMGDYRSVTDYDRYSCGLYAPSVGPMGEDEHAIILMTVTILTEESL